MSERDDYTDRLPDSWWVRRRDLVTIVALIAVPLGLTIVALSPVLLVLVEWVTDGLL